MDTVDIIGVNTCASGTESPLGRTRASFLFQIKVQLRCKTCGNYGSNGLNGRFTPNILDSMDRMDTIYRVDTFPKDS